MLILVLALPSDNAVWAASTIRTIAQHALGPLDYFHLSTVDQLREDWKSRCSDHVMLVADCPDAEIAEVLCRSAAPKILLANDPVSVVDHLRASRGEERAAAIRTASAAFSTLHDLIVRSANLMTVPSPSLRSPARFMEQVVEFLGLSLSAEQHSQILAAIRPDAVPGATSISILTEPADADGRDAAVLTEALKPFHSVFDADTADEFIWPPGLFFVADPLGHPLEGSIDLTGPARSFLYGPYLHLPAGDWTAIARFAVSRNFSGNRLLAEIVAGRRILATAAAPLPPAGAFDFPVPFTVAEPRDPLQMRFSILEGAIEGAFDLIEMKVRRSRRDGYPN